MLGLQPVVGVMCVALFAAGCSAAISRIENPHPVAYMPQREPPSSLPARVKVSDTSWAGSSAACPLDSIVTGSVKDQERSARSRSRLPRSVRLSRGDIINVMLPDGREFNGNYTIGPDGTISLPYVRGIGASGRSEQDVERIIRAALIRKNLFSPELAKVSVRVVHYAAIRVLVRGAVFQPGTHTINQPNGQISEADIAAKAGQAFGSSVTKRSLTAALRVASGVRPDADISRIELVRRGRRYLFDLRGVMDGEFSEDPVLEYNDQITVHSRGCFQPELVRPSQITPRGIRIYVSKIHFGADSRYDEKIPYGLRLLQAAMVASCVGGPKPTRGHREIVLVSTNPVTKKTEVVQRSVETLIRAKGRDTINPYLMPDDSVACYDSPVVEASDAASIINTILTPFKTYQSIKNPSNN